MFLGGLSPEEQYDYYVSKGRADFEQLRTATDPDDINRLVNSIIGSVMSAWGSLGPEQQEIMRSGFLEVIRYIENFALGRSEEGRQEQLSEWEAVRDTLISGFVPVVQAQQIAAENMAAAARNMLQASANFAAVASRPIQVQVTTSEVGYA